MAKPKSAYVCADCGAHSVKWAGQCPDCGAWNTLAEMRLAGAAAAATGGVSATGLDAVELDPEERHATGFDEFDRVLGGGLVLADYWRRRPVRPTGGLWTAWARFEDRCGYGLALAAALYFILRVFA